jgi:hypothetical protein
MPRVRRDGAPVLALGPPVLGEDLDHARLVLVARPVLEVESYLAGNAGEFLWLDLRFFDAGSLF